MKLQATVVGPGPLTLTNILGTSDIELPHGKFAVAELPSGLVVAQTPGIEVPEPKPQLLMGGFFPTAVKAGRIAHRMNLEEYWTGKAA